MNISFQETGVYVFGPFRLDPTRRTVVRGGAAVNLTARLFDTLLYLVQNQHRLISREELESAVWGDRAIGQGNLQKAIFSLRRALQDDGTAEALIATVPGRGFRFTMPVSFEADAAGEAAANPALPAWRRNRIGLAAGAIAVLLTGAAVIYAVIGHAPVGAAALIPPPHSVAVMAFNNLSGDPGQEYFSDGLSEELIDTLGRIPALRVAAPLSSFSFKGKHVPAGQIARELNVGAILEGSVRRQGTTLRVTAQLVDARTGYMIWSSHYDRDQGDLLKVQGAIADAVATAMQVSMVGDDPTRMSVGGTTNPNAFEAYLRGMKLHNERTPQSIKQARAYFNQALALDPHYALAHVRRVSCLISIADGFAEPEPGDGNAKSILAAALAEARLAVSLAPDLGAAHTILGNALEETGNFIQAGTEHTRALQLAPGDPWVNTMYGLYEQLVGHAALAQASAQRGTELDPLSQEAFLNLAAVLIAGREPEKALRALKRAEELGLSGPQVAYVRSQAELEQGDAAAAKRDCSGSDKFDDQCLAVAEHMLGHQADAEAHLAKMRAMWGDDGALNYARVYAAWGQPEDALHWLEVARAQHLDSLIQINLDPWLYRIHDTPRFQAIEASMHFTQ